MARNRPPASIRLRAWIVTGPVGHLYGGVMDWAALLAHVARSKARGTDPWALERPPQPISCMIGQLPGTPLSSRVPSGLKRRSEPTTVPNAVPDA